MTRPNEMSRYLCIIAAITSDPPELALYCNAMATPAPNSTPPTTLDDWNNSFNTTAVGIDSNDTYEYPDDPDDIKVEVKKFRKLPDKTLVVKYNTDLMRRF